MPQDKNVFSFCLTYAWYCSLLYCLLQAKKSKLYFPCILIIRSWWNIKNNPSLRQYFQLVSVWAVKTLVNFCIFFLGLFCTEEAIEVRGEAVLCIAALSLKAVDGLLLQQRRAAISLCESDFSLMESNPNTMLYSGCLQCCICINVYF